MAENINPFLRLVYTTTAPVPPGTDNTYRCVVVMDKYRAVTVRHGRRHSQFVVNQDLKLYPLREGDKVINVKVTTINEVADFIVFRVIDEAFPIYPYGVDCRYELGQSYKMIGIDSKGRYNVKGGLISKVMHGFLIGTHHAEDGDSGAVVLNHRNWFMGMCLAKQKFIGPSNVFHGSMLDIGPIAAHFSYPRIIPAITILVNLPIEENQMIDAEPLEEPDAESPRKKLQKIFPH